MIGIDPHKKRHAAVAMKQDARVTAKRQFDNSMIGFMELDRWAIEQAERTGSENIMFSIEAGGHYWRNIAYYLDDRNMMFHMVSPFTLKRRREGEDLNRRKSDYRDAEMAAELLRTGKFTTGRLPQGVWAELRSTYSGYRRLVKESSRARNLLKGLLDGMFPEFTKVFKNPCAKTALAVLALGLPPEGIICMKPKVFIDQVRQQFQGRGLALKKLSKLYDLAGKTAGVRAGADSVASEIALLSRRISLLIDQIEEQVDRMKELVDTISASRCIRSIPGIGYITTAGLLAELGPLSDYQNARQLIKMAGTNPTQSESAGKYSSRTPMSKKGRSGLRLTLWSAAANLVRLNEDFRLWAQERRERAAHDHPMHRREVLGAVCNRLLRLIYALVTKEELYKQPEREVVAA
jgi:transposase